MLERETTRPEVRRRVETVHVEKPQRVRVPPTDPHILRIGSDGLPLTCRCVVVVGVKNGFVPACHGERVADILARVMVERERG